MKTIGARSYPKNRSLSGLAQPNIMQTFTNGVRLLGMLSSLPQYKSNAKQHVAQASQKVALYHIQTPVQADCSNYRQAPTSLFENATR